MPEKEVVQVYYSAPGGVMEKPYQELAVYQKKQNCWHRVKQKRLS